MELAEEDSEQHNFILTNASIQDMDDDSLLGIINRRMGHITDGHKYRTVEEMENTYGYSKVSSNLLCKFFFINTTLTVQLIKVK